MDLQSCKLCVGYTNHSKETFSSWRKTVVLPASVDGSNVVLAVPVDSSFHSTTRHHCMCTSKWASHGFTFEASDRSRSLSLAQINNLGSDLSLASIVKIARCLQVFVLTSTFLSIRFTRKVSPLYNAVFGLQYSEFTYHPSPPRRWRSQPAAPRLQERHRRYAGCTVYKNYQMSGLTSICIMCKCHIMLYVELNKIHV